MDMRKYNQIRDCMRQLIKGTPFENKVFFVGGCRDIEIKDIDMAVAINVKKAHIYVAYSNMFLLTGNSNSFIAPHYPMRDSRIFIGVNWRLFN